MWEILQWWARNVDKQPHAADGDYSLHHISFILNPFKMCSFWLIKIKMYNPHCNKHKCCFPLTVVLTGVLMNLMKISACKHCGVAEEQIDSSGLNTDQTNFNPISVALWCHFFFIPGKNFNGNAKCADLWISGDKQREELDVGSDSSFNTAGLVLYDRLQGSRFVLLHVDLINSLMQLDS